MLVALMLVNVFVSRVSTIVIGSHPLGVGVSKQPKMDRDG
jgi:hypothetical protein